MYRKARKIRSRLEASNNLLEPIWQKPKGMHWNTFERQREEERRISNLGALVGLQQLEAMVQRSR
jgi:hypothetical protein